MVVVAALCALPHFRRGVRCGGRRSVAASGGSGGCSKRIWRALDASGDGDVDSRRDRPWRRLWWTAASICAKPHLPDLSAAMLPTDRAVPEHPPLPSQVNLRRIRRAVSQRCR